MLCDQLHESDAMVELANQVALQLARVAPNFMRGPDEFGLHVKRQMRFALFGQLEVEHEGPRLFAPKGFTGMNASRVNAPPEKSTMCGVTCGGNFLRPAATLQMNDCEYPIWRERFAARPRSALSHEENLFIHELSKKERLPSTIRKTNMVHSSLMENNYICQRCVCH